MVAAGARIAEGVFASRFQLTGASIGYARVSTAGQILGRQTRALTDAGCIRIFTDKQSGKTADRPELAACLDYLRPGDTLVMPSLDRLSRSLQDLITVVADLRRRGVGFRSLHEAMGSVTAGPGVSRCPRTSVILSR